jgi:hypothetical protein
MSKYVKEAISDFTLDINKNATLPAKRYLFEIDSQAELLMTKGQDNFHSIVVKLLYVSKRCHLDIQLPVAFLCTRVAVSTSEDWQKLKRVLEYLKGTIDDELMIGADELTKSKT